MCLFVEYVWFASCNHVTSGLNMDEFHELDAQEHLKKGYTNLDIHNSHSGSTGWVQAEHPVVYHSVWSYYWISHCIISMIQICIQWGKCFTSLLWCTRHWLRYWPKQSMHQITGIIIWIIKYTFEGGTYKWVIEIWQQYIDISQSSNKTSTARYSR